MTISVRKLLFIAITCFSMHFYQAIQAEDQATRSEELEERDVVRNYDTPVYVSTIQQFDMFLSRTYVVVDFYAPWCQPCHRLSPIIDELARELPDVLFIKVNIDSLRSLASRFSIRSIPTLLFFKNGTQINRCGPLTKSGLKKRIKEVFNLL